MKIYSFISSHNFYNSI